MRRVAQIAASPLPILPGSAFLPGAHHPHCERHRHHLLWLGSRPLCLGCTCMALGALGGCALTMIHSFDRITLVPWLLLHTAMVAPTAAQPWLQWKAFKVFARFMLGLASATWLTGALSSRLGLGVPTEALVAVAVFLVLAKILLLLRDAYSQSPCRSCPLGAYPTCTWNLPRLLAATDDSELRIALRASVAAERD